MSKANETYAHKMLRQRNSTYIETGFIQINILVCEELVLQVRLNAWEAPFSTFHGRMMGYEIETAESAIYLRHTLRRYNNLNLVASQTILFDASGSVP